MRTVSKYIRMWGILLVTVFLTGNAFAQRTVTLKLNTATAPDTLDVLDVIQIRGAVDDTGPFDLPDGNVIDWGDATTLRPQNVGGDNWEMSFQIPDNAKLNFKFYSQLLEDDSVGGWEDGDNHEIAAGVGDVELPLHYFVKGDGQAYDWRPFEDKLDSVAVWYRVFMNTEGAVTIGYDPNNAGQVVGVRGDPLEGASQLDWGATLNLTRESGDKTRPGYHLFSGVAYYPTSAAGMEQPYKFFLEPDGWESLADNRTVLVPAEDSTLPWVYQDNSPPLSDQPVTSDVLFAVDLSPFEEIGIFRRARGDTLWVFGGFNGWGGCPSTNPDLCLMEREPGTDIFAAAVPLTLLPESGQEFKYFLDFQDQLFAAEFQANPPSGWEEGHATGTNRRFEFAGTPEQDLGLQFYNDVTLENVIPAGVSVDVEFSVDMTPAVNNQAQPFDPVGGDSVTVRLGDPIWAFTQGIRESPDGSDQPIAIDFFLLTDDNQDGVYTGTFIVEGPTYSNLTFRYWYGQNGQGFEDQGTDPSTPGRNRTHFIAPNPDGSWPASHTLPVGTFQVEPGPLPFDLNPAIFTGIDVVDGEVPTNIWLGENYPNPFNPTTSFEYSIDQATVVRIKVYDLLGRLVNTVVDGFQQPAVYRVTFDASKMASGLYMYRLETNSQVVSKTMLLLK